MAYGLKYTGSYQNELGYTLDISIYQESFVGDPVAIRLFNEPVLSWSGSDKKESGVIGCECRMQFVHTGWFSVDSLFSSNPREYKVSITDGGFTLFVGWLQGDLARDIYTADDRKRIFEVSATDGLGDLQDVDFKASDGSILKDRDSVRAFIQHAIGLTGLGLNLITSVEMFDSYMSTSANAINQVAIDPKAWIDEEKTKSAREVLEQLCGNFYARLYQRGGKWHFVCIDSFASLTPKAYEYLPNGNQVTTTTSYSHRRTINSNYKVLDGSGQPADIKTRAQLNQAILWVDSEPTKQKHRPIKRLEVAYDYGQMKSQINGNFFGGSIDGWRLNGGISYALVNSGDSLGSYMLRIDGAIKASETSYNSAELQSMLVSDHLTTSTYFSYDERYVSTYFKVSKGELVDLSFDYFAPEQRGVYVAIVFTYKDYKGTEKTESNLYDDLSTIDYDGLGSDGKWYGAEKIKGGKVIRHLLIDNQRDVNGQKLPKASWNSHSQSSSHGVPADGWVKLYIYRGINFIEDNDNASLFIRNIKFGSKAATDSAVNNTVVVLDNPEVEFGDRNATMSISFGEPLNQLNYTYLSRLNGNKTNEQWQSSGIAPPSNIQAMIGAMYLRQYKNYCLVLEGTLRGDTIQMGDTFVMNGYDSTLFIATNVETYTKQQISKVTLVQLFDGVFEPTYYLKTGVKLDKFYGSFFSVVFGMVFGPKSPTISGGRQGVTDLAGEELTNAISDSEVYKNRFLLATPYNVIDLKIGSHKDASDNWADVENAPTGLPAGGHFQVFEGDNDKTIHYVVSVADAATDACFSTRSASLVVVDGVAEQWKYLAQGDTQDFGKISVASDYDQGKATRLDHKVYSADFIDENASLDRGSRSGKINFDKLILPGDYDINWGAGSKHTPPTTNNRGRLKVGGTGCVVWQEYYPYGNGELLYRERSEQRVWESWEVTLVGQTRQDKKVKVPARWHRGRPSGFEWVETYDANTIDTKATYKAGYAIEISADNTISWTGTIGGGVETDPTVPSWVKTITSAQISNWDTAFGWGTHAGLYPLLSGSYANPSFISSLAFSKITGLPTTLAGYGITNAYTSLQVDSLISTIRQVPTGGTTGQYLRGDNTWQALNTTIVPEGTNLYYTDTRARAAFSSGAGINISGGVISSTITQYTNAMARAAISGTGLLSYNSTTGEMSLNTVPWASVTGAPSFITQAYSTVQSNGIARPQRSVINFSSEFAAVDNAGSTRTDIGISSIDWTKVVNAPDFAGLYVPIVRQLTISGTSGRVAVTGGTQNLALSRSWLIDLETLHAGLSGGSGITTPSVNVDAYGRVTSLVYSTILFPVTSVNGKTGSVSLSTTDIPEGTNLYYTDTRARAAFSSGAGINISGGVISSTITQYTNAMARAAISGTGLLSYNSTTGEMSLNTVPWASVTGAPSFITQAYTTVQADTLPVNQRNNLNFSPEFSVADSSANNRTTVGISAVPFAKISGVPAFLTSETDPTVPSHVKAITTENISSWNAKLSGTGDVNYLGKFTAPGIIGNSRIFDNGTLVNIASSNTTGLLNVGGNTNIFGNLAVGGSDAAGYRLRLIDGALYADGDLAAVSIYIPSGRAIRATGTLNIDAGTASPIYFRSGGGATYIMELNSSGQIRFNSYYSATQWSGTAAALLGTDSSGNVITLPTVRTNAENDARYAPISHTQAISTITGLQAALDAKANTIHGHNIGDVTGLQNALDAKADWGHNHDDRYYTKSQLNTSGAGGIVHWNNLIGIPGLSYDGHNHDDRYYTESEVNTFLSGKADWGHNHDDRYYTESESDARYLQAENDPHGFGSQWYSRSGYTVTHGIQKRNGEQYYASFTIPEPLGYDIATQTLLNGSHLIRLNRNDGWYIDRTITETDPYGVSSAYGSYSSGNLSLTIVLRNGALVTCNIPFSGPS